MTQVRRIRPLQGTERGQREQREQGGQEAGDQPDGIPLQKARGRREAVAVRRESVARLNDLRYYAKS